MKSALEKLSEENQKEFWASLALRHCPKMTQRLMRSLLVQYGSAYAVFTEATRSFCTSTSIQSAIKHSNIKNSDYLTATVSLLTPENTKPLGKTFPKDLRNLLKQEVWRASALIEWREAKAFDGEIILWTDYRYPLELKQLIDAPVFLYAKGDISLLSSVCVAIVGSRKYNKESLKKAGQIAEDLSRSGVCVVSGMAKGIDYAAHKGALKGIGKSIAVLGCGADIIYPIENKNIYYDLLENGLILSEFSPRTQPLSQNFPVRNRIVSGVCAAVLVAEAALRSGSLITARIALEQNRHVYALKPVYEGHSIGAQNLINDGAIQVEDAMGILVDIAPQLENKVMYKSVTVPTGTSSFPSIDFPHLISQKDVNLEIVKAPSILLAHSQNENFESKNNDSIIQKQYELKSKNIQLKKMKIPKAKVQKKEDINTQDCFKNKSNNTDSTKIDIDFVSLTQKLMGEQKDVDIIEILKPSKRKKSSLKNTKIEETLKDSKDKLQNNTKSMCEMKAEEKDISQLEKYEQNILNVLKIQSPLSPDDILLQMNSSDISELTTTLLMLEVDGYVERISGNRYRLL